MTHPDPVVANILTEEKGNQSAVIRRLRAKGWLEGEIVDEIAKCLAQGVRRDPPKRSRASHG